MDRLINILDSRVRKWDVLESFKEELRPWSVHVGNLKTLIAILEANRGRLVMSNWVSSITEDDENRGEYRWACDESGYDLSLPKILESTEETTECGTAGCLAGWCAALAYERQEFPKEFVGEEDLQDYVGGIGRELAYAMTCGHGFYGVSEQEFDDGSLRLSDRVIGTLKLILGYAEETQGG